MSQVGDADRVGVAATATDADGQRLALGRWWALGALTVLAFMAGWDATVLNVALPTLARTLQASESQLQWFVAGYMLMLAAALLPGGLLGDRYGRRLVLLGSFGSVCRRIDRVRILSDSGVFHSQM